MILVLDGISAFEYWMSATRSASEVAVGSGAALLTNFDGTSCKQVSDIIERNEGSDGPLELLALNKCDRRQAPSIVCRCWGGNRPLPPGSLYPIGDAIYTISPELCVVRLASMLPRLEYLRAVTDLLSIFQLSFSNRQDLISRNPITNKQDVASYIEGLGARPGTALAKRCLPWVVENTASPRETSMALALGLPTKVGGQGMPPFEANYHVQLDDDSRPLTQKGFLVADVAWPEWNRVLEYNSSKYHDSEEQKEFDFEKITAMQVLGKTVTPVSTRQFNNYEAFASIVRNLRSDFGLRDRYSSEVEERRRATHEQLLATERQQREQRSLNETKRWQFLLQRIDFAV